MRGRIVGISGKAGSGKDTFYQAVLAGEGYVRVAWADELKAEAIRLHGLSYAEVFGPDKDPEVRRLLQDLGDGRRREVDPGVWIYHGLKSVKSHFDRGRAVAVTDVRYPNEAWALRGDVGRMRSFYAGYEGPVDPAIREALTHEWGEGGLLPPPGVGLVVKIERLRRPPLPPEMENHPSELAVDQVEPDLLLRVSVEGRDYLDVMRRFWATAGVQARQGVTPR